MNQPLETSEALRESAMGWSIRAHAVADRSHSFGLTAHADEATARAEFEKAREHAKKHGGAAELRSGFTVVDRFSHWCPDD